MSMTRYSLHSCDDDRVARWRSMFALPGLPPQVTADTVPASVTVLDTSRV
jgi:hypothetical protein